ncbi:MAG: type 4a pilus biogenesis protein PilO [Sulfuricella sp.]
MKRLLSILRRPIASRSDAATTPPLWNRVRWTARHWLRRIGAPGILAIGILAMCPALYFSAIRPEQARLDSARHSVAALHEQLEMAGKSSGSAKLSPAEQLTEFYGKFPHEECSPQWLEKLVALAASRGLTLNDGEYKATREKVGKLVRYQMTLPVKGEYPQIRRFLTDVPGVLPVIALENVQFERQKVADPNIEAKIKMVLYLEQAS